MKTLIRHIEYLLQHHDCVIIPGLGAILCHGESASFTSQGCWLPPQRVLSFNPALDRTDGLLASSLSRRDSISIDTASTRVATAAAEMRRTLSETGSLELGLAGQLTLSAEGFITYEPGNTALLSPATMWLPEFKLTPVAKASQLARRIEGEEMRRSSVRRIARRAGIAAASIAAVFTLGIAIKNSLPEAAGKQYASVAPVTTSRSIAPVPGESQSSLVLVIKHFDDSSIPVEEACESEAPLNHVTAADVNTKQTAARPMRVDDSDPYILVVASVSSQSEADKFIKKNSPFNLGVLNEGGRIRVFAASGNSAAAVQAAKTGDIAERFPDAWVCRR